jgi:hypothetical protein
LVTGGATVLLCLLGAASLTGDTALRAAADGTALIVLVTYLRAPALIGRTSAQLENTVQLETARQLERA